MSYVENNLLPDENILYKAKIHWSIYLYGLICLVLAFIIPKNNDTIWPIILSLLGIYLLIKAYTYVKTTEFVVTNMRVIAKKGWLRRHAIELRHEKVEGLSLDQGILDRVFNRGSLVLNGTGGSKERVYSISNPLNFRKQAMEAIGQKS